MDEKKISITGDRGPGGGNVEILETIVETMPGAVYIAEWIEGHGFQYGQIYESPSIEQFTGISPGELLAHPGSLLELVHPEDRRSMVDALYGAVHSPAEVETTYRMRHARTGRWRWIHEKIRSLVPKGEKNKKLIIGVLMDVTKLHETEEELRRAKERMRVLVEGTPYLFFYTQDKNGDVTYVSPSVERLTGYSVDEWLGQRHWFTTENRINDPARAATHQHLRGEMDTPAFQFEIRHKDGHSVLLETYEHPIFVDGEPAGIQGVARDITQQRKLQEALLESRKMEAVGRLAAGLSHDFNNMLQGIMSCADLIVSRSSEDGIRSLAREIAAISERGAALVQQLLAYSRRQVFEPVPIDLNAVIQENAPFLQRLLGDDIHISLDLLPGLPTILGDRSQLEQVLLNLTSNAREAMPDGGEVRVATRLEPADGNPANVVLTFEDEGHGMDAALVDKIFEPYFTTRTSNGGTGLGLASVKGIVELHRGTIEVQSSPAKGTVFTVHLPAAAPGTGPSETVEPEKPATIAPPEHEATIFLVDDNADVRQSLAEVLTFSGYTTITASTVGEALKGFEEREPDLLLTDLQLPDGSGLDLIANVRSEKGADFPVILMSGYPRGGLPANLGTLPDSVLFLEKPVRLRNLLDAINVGLGGRDA